MQATENELAAFGERRQRDEERNAVAFLAERYRRIAGSVEVFGAYMGELRGDARAAAIRDLCKRVGLTVKAELAFLELAGHPYPIGDAVKPPPTGRFTRLIRWLLG